MLRDSEASIPVPFMPLRAAASERAPAGALRPGLSGETAYRGTEAVPIQGEQFKAFWMVSPMGETAYTAHALGAGIIVTLLLAVLSAFLIARNRMKKVVAELQCSEQRFSSFFHHAPIHCFVFLLIRDACGEIIDWELREVNTLGTFTCGKPYPEIIGKRASEIFGAEIMVPYIERSREVSRTGKPQQFETLFPVDNRYYYSSVFPLGEELYGVASIDITERIKAEEAERIQSENLQKALEKANSMSRAMETARENDRTLIAREIHDELGQALTVMQLNLYWQRDHLDVADGIIRETIEEISDTSRTRWKVLIESLTSSDHNYWTIWASRQPSSGWWVMFAKEIPLPAYAICVAKETVQVEPAPR